MSISATSRALALCFALVALACGSEPAEPQPERIYTIRGVVRGLPSTQPREWIEIRHEAIPDFVGLTGELEPMEAMTMTFTAAETLDFGDVKVGDKVGFQLKVDWDASPPAEVTSLSILPPETKLVFTK